jgi:hypothetical protein
MATVIRNETAVVESLKAVIVYDTFNSAVRAKRMLQDHRTDEPIVWNIKPWRVDILKLPQLELEALREAADAHLILIAGDRVQSLLPGLLDWLERWASCRRIKEAGLALWDGFTPAGSQPERRPELSEFVGRHRLVLLGEGRATIGDAPSVFADDLHERKDPETSTSRSIREQPLRADNLRSGIDE